ncbi:hypothetical protein J2X29_003779 [Shewanella putrefaciens]|nr:hypothetical protein [Shewanella putrefaciens]
MVFSHISPNAQLSGLKKPRRSLNVGSKSSQMAALFVSAIFNTDYILMDDHPHLAPQKILIHVQSGTIWRSVSGDGGDTSDYCAACQ